MGYDARKTEWRRTRERRLVRRALVFYGWTTALSFLVHCQTTHRIDLRLLPVCLAVILVATALHALAGVNPPDATFWRERRATKR